MIDLKDAKFDLFITIVLITLNLIKS